MEIQGQTIYLSFNDVTNIKYWGSYVGDPEILEWGHNLASRFEHPLDESEFTLNTVPIPCTPRVL